MHRKVLLALITAVFLLSIVLAGCQSGIAQDLYDQVSEQLNKAKEQLARVQDEFNDMQDKVNDLQAEKAAVEENYQAAQAEIDKLLSQISTLKEQYDMVGDTPAETAEKIVKYYHDTHEYSMTDLFICSDMASEVWNMLKAQGIDAIIVVGNKDMAITNILQSNHAWVLAEVEPGKYLALETTGGFVVYESENPLYYRGWYFDSPRDLDRHNELVREYNVRVGIINQIQDEVIEVAKEHDQSGDPVTADKLFAVYEKLVEVRDNMDVELKNIEAELNSLATKCGT